MQVFRQRGFAKMGVRMVCVMMMENVCAWKDGLGLIAMC